MKKGFYYNKQTLHNLSKHKVTATTNLTNCLHIAVSRSSILSSNWLSATFIPLLTVLGALVIKLGETTVTNGTVSIRSKYTCCSLPVVPLLISLATFVLASHGLS